MSCFHPVKFGVGGGCGGGAAAGRGGFLFGRGVGNSSQHLPRPSTPLACQQNHHHVIVIRTV